MQIRKGKPPGSVRLAGIGVELGRQARVRLAWMDYYRRTKNVAQTCRHFGISRQTFLPPRSPKLNGAVERANRTHTEEFYQVTPCSLEMKKLNRELRQWKNIYNTVRPHQALGYLTPLQFLRQTSSQRKE
jgi:transposase InsO family protein